MFYIKWKNNRRTYRMMSGLDYYFMGINLDYCWGPLKDAVPFATELKATQYFDSIGTLHWIDSTEVVFLHPLNFDLRSKK